MEKENSIEEFLFELDQIAESSLSEDASVQDTMKRLEAKIARLYHFVGNLSGGNANRNIQIDGVNVLRPFTDINFKTGSGVTFSTSANQTTKYTDITLAASASGYQSATGTVDGSNTIFVFSTAPKIICVDQGRLMQQTSSDGTVNWTGTTTITLSLAPNFDIFGVS